MAKNRSPEVPVDDYDLGALQEIIFRDLTYYVMPRYKEHYVAHAYESFTLDIFLSCIRSDSTIIDIGAHFGAYSLLGAQKAVDGRVYAFEPVPENRAVLTKNAVANDLLSNIDINPSAISDKQGTASFNIPWASDSAGFYEHPNAETVRVIDVNVAVVDEIFAGRSVDVMKIDTEGNEIKVLKGCQKLIRANKNIKLFVEFNPECLEAAGYQPHELIAELQSQGFKTYFVEDNTRELVRVDKPTQWSDAMNGRDYANVYCVPATNSNDIVVAFHSADLGGAELATLELVQGMQQAGDVIHALLPSDGPLETRLKDAAVSYTVVPYIPWARLNEISPKDLHNQDYVNVRACETIYRLLAKLRPEMCMTSTITIPWAALAASAAGIPHAWMIHEYGDKDHGLVFDYQYGQVLKIVDELSQTVFVNSKSLKEHLTSVIPVGKIRHIYYGMPEKTNLGAASVPKLFKGVGTKLVVVGKITDTKGQYEAVRAAGELIKSGVPVQLLVLGQYGPPKYINTIKNFIKENKLSKSIFIHDYVDNPYPYIQQADILLMCSLNEALGRVTMEGMMLAKPVVGSASGGTQELIDDTFNGLLFEPGSYLDLAAKLTDLVTNEPLQKEMGQRGYIKYKAEYSFEKYIDSFRNSLALLKTSPSPSNTKFYEKILPVYAQISDDEMLKQAQLNVEIDIFKTATEAANQEVAKLRSELHDIKKSKGWKLLAKAYTVKHRTGFKKR